MNKKIIDYILVGRMDSYDFWKDVDQAIKDGWQPYGYAFERGDYLCQAMVKYENN